MHDQGTSTPWYKINILYSMKYHNSRIHASHCKYNEEDQVNENAITWLLFLVFEFKRQWLWRVAPWFGGLGRLVVLEEFLVVVTVTRFRDGHLCYRSWGKLSLSLHWGAPWGRADRGRFLLRYFHSVLGCSW